jgi:hypothetical protein
MVMFFPVHAMKSYRKNRIIAPLILTLGLRWRRLVNFTRPGHFSLGIEPRSPLYRGLRKPQGRSGRFGENRTLFSLPGLLLPYVS